MIKLESRNPGVDTEVEVLPDNRGIITSTGEYVSVMTDEKRTVIKALDFEGGPAISIGDTIDGHKIKSFRSAFIVEFE